MFVPSNSSWILIAWLLILLSTRVAALPNRKFEQWYGTYGNQFNNASTTVCNHTLSIYLEGLVESTGLAIAHHADCILTHTTETIKTNMGSAGVILGLTPSLLSFMGPTIPELSILTLERPLLSALLALGGPAIWPARGFEKHSPLKTSRTFPKVPHSVRSIWWIGHVVSAIEYMIAIAAAFNVIDLCMELGWKTIVTWKKSNSYLPLAWVLLGLFVHICAILRLQCARMKLNEKAGTGSCRKQSKRHWLLLDALFIAETRLCCLRPKQDHAAQQEDQETFFWYNYGIALSAICTLHQVLGVMIFSSLLFIGVYDLITVIIRFGVSATVAQYIRMFEISGLLVGCDKPCQNQTSSLDQFPTPREEKEDRDEKGLIKSGQIGGLTLPPQ